MHAVHGLGESADPGAARYLIAALRDGVPAVSVAAVRALERLRDRTATIPLYELVQNETADPWVRQEAAELLVKRALLRRRRVGPSRIFIWLLGMVLILVCLAAASSIGAGAIGLFAAGLAALVGYYVTASRKERRAGEYIGPDGGAIHIPETSLGRAE